MELKEHPKYGDYFLISKCGKVFSKRTHKFLKQTISKTGYYTISTRFGGRNGTSHCFKVHRLVAETFIINANNKPHVNHIDDNKLNNSVDNLEWATAKENIQHAISTGLTVFKKGLDSPNSKLTISDIVFIQESNLSSRKLAKIFDVSHVTILEARKFQM